MFSAFFFSSVIMFVCVVTVLTHTTVMTVTFALPVLDRLREGCTPAYVGRVIAQFEPLFSALGLMPSLLVPVLFCATPPSSLFAWVLLRFRCRWAFVSLCSWLHALSAPPPCFPSSRRALAASCWPAFPRPWPLWSRGPLVGSSGSLSSCVPPTSVFRRPPFFFFVPLFPTWLTVGLRPRSAPSLVASSSPALSASLLRAFPRAVASRRPLCRPS